MKRYLLSGILAAFLPFAALAQQAAPVPTGLSTPVIALTGVLAKNADALGLTDSQRAALKDWVGTMPARREALEAETVALRADMQAAIATGSPVAERQELADKIGANETALIMMRSDCVDHWRAILSPEQFAKLLQLADVN
ncbi:hypothetical protein CCR83_14785 [Rhodobacter veldkampii DSM 11550]|uniref:LTXXQ motif family protein n=1 Tax=Phaeovulum veldkampii DSM 11550 TaxID=1185920 RepID=A0A2T4JMD3_9RHOB|nr:Spy/CpxP family protein refolding chaperone [Phaeovulum veldkampii]MBK5947677.1 hypothetical protein [Phaeovulum veldkampii DSM 11550]PTE19038.1 hypothetical protein C5F46_00950 [Phaeovulum veldkampii DSM 11550]TDQ61419.1 LTXXQ motif family protein [Phaeovulum veldkampii DSM 11550]